MTRTIRPLIIIAALALLAACTSAAEKPGSAITLPESIGSRTLAQTDTGEDAMAQITRLHGKEIDVDEAIAARYEGADGRSYVWISVSASDARAEELFRLMDDMMPDSTVFTGRRTFDAGQTPLVQVDGMGMTHYYWVAGRAVVWLSVAGSGASEQVEELFEAIGTP